MIILDLLTLAPVFLSALFFPANGQSWAFHLFPSIKHQTDVASFDQFLLEVVSFWIFLLI